MELNYDRYKGIYPYKMDPKYRVSVVASWREDPKEQFFLMLSSKGGQPVIKVLTKEAYGKRVDQVLSSNKTEVEKQQLLEMLALLCRDATLNDQGKLLIPKDLSESAGITADSDVVLAGGGLHFEVWSKANFENFFGNFRPPNDLGIF